MYEEIFNQIRSAANKRNLKDSTIHAYCTTIGIVVSEIYKFFTWHVMNITGEVSIHKSIRFAFPEFYIGLIISILMVVTYFVIDKKVSATSVSN